MTLFYGEPAWMVSSYDYQHCMGYYTGCDRRLVVSAATRQAIITRTLCYQGSRYPMLSLMRLPKFIARGYTIDLGNLFQLVLEVAAGGLGDRGKLHQLLGLLTEKDRRFAQMLAATETLPEGPVDQATLAAILRVSFAL
jgi:hypothetical protein